MAVEDSVPRTPGMVAAEVPKIVHTDLRKGSVGLAGVLMQSVAQISPTLGIFYTIAFRPSPPASGVGLRSASSRDRSCSVRPPQIP